MGLAWLALLVIPLGHQVRSHRIHIKAVRMIWPGPAAPLTEHERRHAARPARLRIAADVAWLVSIALILAVTLAAAR